MKFGATAAWQVANTLPATLLLLVRLDRGPGRTAAARDRSYARAGGSAGAFAPAAEHGKAGEGEVALRPPTCLLTRPAAPRAQVRSRARLGQPLGRVTSIVFELRDTSIVKLVYGPGRCPQEAVGGAQIAANSRA